MKKIKYGKKIEAESKELLHLKQGDQLCGAVLDTFSDDYLSYITHLVKNTKTPIKNKGKHEQEYHSSDSQPQQLPKSNTVHPPPLLIPHPQAKVRHHSESGVKKSPTQAQKQSIAKLNSKFDNNYTSKYSPVHRGHQTMLLEEGHAVKNKKRKIEYANDMFAKNQQKTMTFSRNVSRDTGIKLKDNKLMQERDRWPTEHVKQHTKSKQKYIINSQKAYASDQAEDEQLPSIERLYKKDRQSAAEQSKQEEHKFISNINQYLDNLQANRSLKVQKQHRSSKRMTIQKLIRKSQKQHRMADLPSRDERKYDTDEILRQNLKLKKRVKAFQQKIEQFQDEISNHLIQCKSRDKSYKNKISELVKALTHAVAKINNQKTQIACMTEFLRSFGHQAKQIQHQNDDDSQEMQDDINESIIKFIGPQRNSSDIRTKYKKMLEATMPKHEEDRKLWRD